MLSNMKVGFTVRRIEEDDLRNGFFQTLSNLTEVGEISNDLEKAKGIFHKIKSNSLYNILVAVKDDGEIIGAATLLLEQKFIHDGGKVGHIEDIVTKKGYERMGVGSTLVQASVELARKNNCYKVILDCAEKNVVFFEKVGFRRHGILMRYDIK